MKENKPMLQNSEKGMYGVTIIIITLVEREYKKWGTLSLQRRHWCQRYIRVSQNWETKHRKSNKKQIECGKRERNELK